MHSGRTGRGELSLFAHKVVLLAPCMQLLPPKHPGLQDQEVRYRQRYLDLIMNPTNRNIFYTRSRITNYIRRFLDQQVSIVPFSLALLPCVRAVRVKYDDVNWI